MGQTVKIWFEAGKIKFDFDGYTGKACLNDMTELEKALREFGVKLDDVKIELKPEVHEKERVKEDGRKARI